jgi:ubiquinone/menaquinone biosynthesis C-methylase UbiE
MREVNPYEKLAYIYDRLMDHVDYKYWAIYILDLINQSELKVQSIIDLSCGTGNLIPYFDGIIDKIWGCDQSKPMIFQSREKIKDLSFFVNDVKQMAIKDNSADCALLLYDSLNYINNVRDLKMTLREIHRIIKEGGMFIFDIVSETHCKEYYGDYHESEYWDNLGYTRHSYFDQEEGIQINDFRIVLKGKTYFEKHIQKVYSIDFLNKILCEHSFEIVNIFNEFSFEGVNEKSGRMHFVCLRK